MPSGDAARPRSVAAAGNTGRAVSTGGLSGSWTAAGKPAGRRDPPAAPAPDAGSIRGPAGVGGVSTVVSPGSINAGVSSCAEASCAAAGIEGDGADFAGPWTGGEGGSGQPASRGVSTMGSLTMATGPLSDGAAGSGVASISGDSAGVPAMAAFGIDVRRLLSTRRFSGGRGAGGGDGGRDELVRIARAGAGGGVAWGTGRPDAVSSARLRSGTELTRSVRLTRDASAPADHRGACVARTSPNAMTAWNSTEQTTATPITSSGRRLSP